MTALTVQEFNGLPVEQARQVLAQYCSSLAWAHRIADSRPYAGRRELLERAESDFARLTDAELVDALSAHPRIGEQPTGDGAEAAASRREQAAVTDADDAVRRQLQSANRAYEQRFDRVFLIRAAGRGPEEILAELHRRLDNDPDTERAEVLGQLGQITRLRLEEAIRT
ncbi:MAG: 2-oxo-4-hydroxy-4-carboxy-5-ureidoimidazoline decarboxylase [Geodermatophilaceae bacterium]